MTSLRKGSTIFLGVAALTLGVSIATAQSPSSTAPAAAQPGAAAGAAAGAGTPVSWEVFSGYKRYHGNCSVCHGPDGLGGTFAPALATSLKTMDHDAFLETVVNGKQNSQLAMPAFGADPNVMCYIEEIYTYLKARSDDKIGRGRPAPQPAKPADIGAAEAACMGS
ncbi:MAG TPA: c-type cytochrome [Sphingomonas sp.]|jgi:methanol metabolism-related c-type cytochrome|nr:c-type cytochrome [Sphingomonas sp.]